jgi:dTDP-4-amino-4,6-dideoxygalactose transaminase
VIVFNKPCYTGNENKYLLSAIKNPKLSGDGQYGLMCQKWFEKKFNCVKALLTPSCTHALEMAALIINTAPGDEIIMPSYTFVSTANAFILRGAKIIFIDIKEETLNIDENLIENAITERTKAIVVVHYAGVACNMKKIKEIANKYGVYLVEDAAQALLSKYENQYLGTYGHMAAFSFHETKNITSGGEGGLLVINDENLVNRANIIREKGTNRTDFINGKVDKYTWKDIGSSYLPSELQSAYLWGQLEKAEEINQNRQTLWNKYKKSLTILEKTGNFRTAVTPENCQHNGHIFYIILDKKIERKKVLINLNNDGVMALSHYVPLHTSPYGIKCTEFYGEDINTSYLSEKIIRLPIWYGMDEESQQNVVDKVIHHLTYENEI